MPRINRIEKSRKEQKCSKCGKILPKGSTYLKSTPYHQSPIIRCIDCGIKSWELSTSEYIQTVGRIREEWESDYGTDYEAIRDDLQELLDTCQESYDQIPENLQYGPTGELIQERMDNLDTVINELDSIDEDSLRSEAEDEYREENNIDEDVELNDSEELESLVEDKIREAISDAIEYLEC